MKYWKGQYGIQTTVVVTKLYYLMRIIQEVKFLFFCKNYKILIMKTEK